MMARGEVEAVDGGEGGCFGMDTTGGDDGGVPILVLEVGFEGPVVAQVVVHAEAGRVDGGAGTEIEDVVVGKAAVEVVDAAATNEKIDIGAETSESVLDPGAEEEALLAADVAAVDGVGPAEFEGRPEVAKSQEGEVGACGDSAIFAAFEVGVGAG